MSTLKLFTLGPPRLELNGTPIEIERRKALALLIYLAVSGQPHSRDALAALFWPDHSQSRARAYLRRDLAVLNTSLAGDWIIADRETIELKGGPELWLDVEQYRRLVAACRSHGHPAETVCPDCLPLLEEAAILYTGNFLAGFTLRDSPEFDDWQFFQTETLRQEVASTLERLAIGYSERKEFERAIPYARRWLALDPLHEPAQRQLMRVYDQAGQPAAALRQYEEYVELLERELGLPPEEETTTLYEAIKAKRIFGPFIKAEEQKSQLQAEQAVQPQKVDLTTPIISPPVLPDRRMEQQIRFCISPDGVRIAYATLGEGPLLVKAGNPFTHLTHDRYSPVWRHWWEGLAQRHTLVRYDERGSGLSDRNVTDFSMEAWVQDLESVVNQFGSERFVLLGVSQGASVAIAYAVRHPERVSHLILYGGYVRGRFHREDPQYRQEAQTLIAMTRMGWGKDHAAFRQVFTSMFIPEGTPEQLNWFNDLIRVTSSPENAAAMHTAFYDINVTDLAPKVTVPTLVIHALGDVMCPFEEGQLMAKLIPGARFVSLEGKNHILLESEPAWHEFLSELHRFIEEEPPANLSTTAENVGRPKQIDQPLEKIKTGPKDERVSAGSPPRSASPVAPHEQEVTDSYKPLPVTFTPFVGRRNEYEQLITAVNRTRRGQGQVVLIGGEPGIGKSRLSEEAAHYAQNQGVKVLWQKCYSSEQTMPYQVLVDLVGQMLANWKPAAFRQIPASSLAELALLTPDITSIFPNASPLPTDLAEARQARLFRALHQFVTAPAAENALMFVIDDIHWADQVTLQFLHHLAHQIVNQPVILICTYRNEEITANPPLEVFLHGLMREPYTSQLLLSRLSLEDANSLVEMLPAGPHTATLGQWLYQETDGNPFFLISILQSLQEQGVLTAETEAGWRIDLRPLQHTTTELTLPDALRQSVRERLRRLPQPGQQLLDLAAVYGRRFDFVTLQEITDDSPTTLLNLIELLLARQLLREEEEDNGYDFSHDKIREVVYYDLSRMRRVLLHRQVAEALEMADSRRVERLAEHFEKGEVWGKAIAYLAQAASRARQLFAMEEALRFYDRAITLAERFPRAVSQPILLDLYEQRGETRGLMGGQVGEAVADLELVLDAAREAYDQDRERVLLIRIGQVYRYGDHYRQALDYLKEALDVARRSGDERGVADALYHLGTTVWSQGHNDQALAYHQEAVEICRRLELTDLVAVQAYHGLGEAYFLAGRAKEAIELYEESLQLARKIQDRGYESENLGNMGMAMQVFGIADYDRARKVFTRALKISQSAHLEWHSTQILGPLGLAHGLSGNYRQALDYLQRSLQIAESIGAKRFHSLLLDMYGMIWQELNLPDRAKLAHEQALELAQQADAGWWLPRIRANLAIDRLRLGDLDIQKVLQTTFEQAMNRHLELHAIRCLEGLAELALARKEPGQALQHAERLQQLAEPGDMREIIAQAYRWQGEALSALGKPELAIAKLEQSLALAETLGRPRLEADIHGLLANIFQAQGVKDKAAQHKTQVEKLNQEITHNWQDLSLQANLMLDQAVWRRDQPMDLNLVVSEIVSYEPPASSKAASPTTLIDQRYIQEELIAVGGMGQVYRGHDLKNGQAVAIKRLKAELVSHNPEAVKRFIREGETLRRLNHPNIVKILATFEIENQPIIVMEYVSGGSLQDLLEQQPNLPITQVLNLGLELADALARVHHLNIIHRDLKPANILLAEDGAPRLTDFGVAYLSSQDTRLTQTGAILGTTVYMSPEAWRGEPLDARSDIWSFGAVLFEMLAGQPPFAAENVIAVMTAILNNPIPDLYQFRPDAPPALVELIKHMLVKERHLRLDSMRQVAAGLEVIRRDLTN